MGKRESGSAATVTERPEVALHVTSELEAVYAPVEIPLAGSEGPDIRNVHIRLTARQAVAYRRLRAGLVSLGERLDDGRLVDDTIRGQPLQWVLERIADAK
jgi:hypothetical protein